MRYKEGDIVKVRYGLEVEEFYGNGEDSKIRYTYLMDRDFSGKIVTIDKVLSNYYKIKEDDGTWEWNDRMLEDINIPGVIEYFMSENGLKVGQRFTIESYSCKFYFNAGGVLMGGDSEASPATCYYLLTGKSKIKSKFQEVRDSDEFWYVSPVGEVERGRLDCCPILGKALMVFGNFFLREKDAEDCKSLILLKWNELDKKLKMGIEVGV